MLSGDVMLLASSCAYCCEQSIRICWTMLGRLAGFDYRELTYGACQTSPRKYVLQVVQKLTDTDGAYVT